MLEGIRIVTASAGSGKTYRLAELLEEAITAHQVPPERILATTFTRKAAAELTERVRRRLLGRGHTEPAQRLAGARIGTVNSVCGALLVEHAFRLGLPPDLETLDEEASGRLLRRALSTAATDPERRRLAELESRFPELEWEETIKKMVDLARDNGIDEEELRRSGARSVEELEAALGAADLDEGAYRAELSAVIAGFLAGCEEAIRRGVPERKDTTEALELVRSAGSRLARGHLPSWADLGKLGGQKAGADFKELVEPVNDLASEHVRLGSFRRDLREVIELVHEVAARSMHQFAELKAAWGAVDFKDQEARALELLRDEEIREALRGQIELVLVDEFQDTSPIQLAIFLELARTAPRSVWVGDQKQSIFGFRGTDPALMDAAIREVEAKGREAVETLTGSWRSRPGLVAVTSGVFVGPFEAHGIPPERVRLEARVPETREDLGPIVERWTIRRPPGESSWRKRDEVGALARGVRELIEGGEVRVRDPVTEEAAALRPGHVAVLCQRNSTASDLAVALGELGIPAALDAPGLLGALEARLAIAGLRLFVDSGDTLARAEIARILDHPGEEDAWLAELLAAEEPRKCFGGSRAIEKVLEARERIVAAGAVPALDSVLEALELREVCLGWGNVATRLDNVQALRGHAVAFAERALEEGASGGAAALLAHLEWLASEEEDRRRPSSSGDAVTVLTWHRAKGLEWPVTVLYELEKVRETSPFGVHVLASPAGFDLSDPLRGRRVRYYPNPYRSERNPVQTALVRTGEVARLEDADRREDLRLLYVGWTRARDRVVLATRATKGVGDGILGRLCDGGAAGLSEPGATGCWGGVEFRCVRRELVREETPTQERVAEEAYQPAGAREHPPATRVASGAAGEGRVLGVEELGARLPIGRGANERWLGEALHGFLAADHPGRTRADREALATGILARYRVPEGMAVEDMLTASERLREWAGRVLPGARWRTEWPVLHRREDGSVLSGRVDLLLESEGTTVVVDHKLFPGSRAKAEEKAIEFAGQLEAYAAAVRAADRGRAVRTFVHFPVGGMVVEVEHLPSMEVRAAVQG